jgi:SpoVK/Ycf46/Vps4 family AAA+-type ATPase
MKSESLRRLVEARHPLIAIETADEPRALRAIRTAIGEHCPLATWSVTEGLVDTPPSPVNTLVEPGKVVAALRHVQQTAFRAVYVFRDLAPHCRDPQVVRQLREMFFTPGDRPWTLFLVDVAGLPPEVRRLAAPVALGWPDEAEIEALVKRTFQQARTAAFRDVTARISGRELEQIVQLLRGLTTAEAERVVMEAIVDDDALDGSDLPRIMEAKRNLLTASGCLEARVADVGPDDIGGLAALKRWLEVRRGGFSPRARAFGLDPPRGILLLGVQGCGKSLSAKVVAASWQMPLLRMDPGVFYQKFIGESEARMREALAQAESMAPVVLWIDEIEKAFASSGATSADGGLSQRMFGTLLSWLQDHRHPIFVVATANDITQLPPELMRKGRFDEIFFVDLPGTAERRAIFAIHLRRRKRDVAGFELDRLAAAAAGLSGAEIEQAVVAGMYDAFSRGSDLTTDHVLAAIAATQPLSVVLRERVEALRAWARGRCIAAD